MGDMSNQIASNAVGVGLQQKGIRSFPSKEVISPNDSIWTRSRVVPLKLRKIEECGQVDSLAGGRVSVSHPVMSDSW